MLKKVGHFQVEIAQLIGVDKSTISRELRRNHGRHGYRPNQDHRLALERSRFVSYEWIYQYVYADKANDGDLHTFLRCQKKRKKRYGSNNRRGKIPNRIGIE